MGRSDLGEGANPTSEQLRRRQAYADEAQRLSRTGSFGWRLDTGEIVWSEETFRILDYDLSVSPSLALYLQRVHPDDVGVVQRAIDDAAGGVDLANRLVMPDGAVKHVHIVGRALRDVAGNIEIVGAVMDVTEQQRAKAALESAQEQMRLVIDTIPAYVWSATPEGKVDFMTRPYIEYHGVTIEQAVAADWTLAVHPDDVPASMAAWERSVATGETFDHELRVRRIDGVYRWLVDRAVPLRDAEGRIVRWYGTAFDIEERKRTEMLLAGSERTFEMMARGAPLGDVLTALCALVEELSPESLTSILLLDAATSRLHHGAAPSIPPSYSQAIDGGVIGPAAGSCGTAAWRGEAVVVVDIANDPLWKDYRDLALAHDLRACWSTPILSATGRVLGTFAVYLRHPGVTDPSARGVVAQVTDLASIAIERERAREALRNAEAELAHVARVSTLGEVTASIAHEVNQPLAAIVNNAGACLALLPDGPELAEIRAALGDIVREGERAAAVVHRVRGLATRSATKTVPLRLGDVVEDVVELARAESVARKVNIRCEVGEDLPSVIGDRVQLQQVVLNLVVNGMDAMNAIDDDGRLLVIRGGTECPAGRLAAVIRVEDRGVGLAAVQMARLFDPFYTTKPSGMGMGLAISRSIILQHGGRLWAEPNVGRGATFAFSVPAAAE